MSEKELTPWEEAHKKYLESQAAAEVLEEKKERRAFLGRLKLTRQTTAREPLSISEKYEGVNQADDFDDLDDYDNSKEENSSESVKSKPVKKSKQPKPSKLPKAEKEGRPIRPVLKRLWFLLLVFFLVILGSIYEISPISTIGKLTIVGNTDISSLSIVQASKISSQDKVLSLLQHRSEIENKVKASDPRIDTVQLHLSLPNTIGLTISEYANVAYLSRDKQFYPVLSNGYVNSSISYKTAPNKTLVVLNGLTNAEVKSFVTAYNQISASLQAQIVSVSMTPTPATADFAALNMKDGNQVRVALSQLTNKLPYYPSVASQLVGKGKQVIDMEVGIYATPYNTYMSEYKNYKPGASSSSSSSSSSSASASSTSGSSSGQ